MQPEGCDSHAVKHEGGDMPVLCKPSTGEFNPTSLTLKFVKSLNNH